MDEESDGFDLERAISDGVETVRETFSFLGIEREAHVCPDCNVACEPGYAYDVARAAFDEGESPVWRCSECGTEYRREVSDESHTLDLYGRG